MKILTHNMLCCLKCDHFPLNIHATDKQEQPQDENFEFITHMLPKIDYPALRQAASDLNIVGLPETLPDNITENEQALRSLHKLLLEVTVVEGELVCPNCSRAYSIKNKIPNMVLREDELLEKQKKQKAETKKVYDEKQTDSDDLSQHMMSN
jgi:multifunctional methyltransferase subunit TRM112